MPPLIGFERAHERAERSEHLSKRLLEFAEALNGLHGLSVALLESDGIGFNSEVVDGFPRIVRELVPVRAVARMVDAEIARFV